MLTDYVVLHFIASILPLLRHLYQIFKVLKVKIDKKAKHICSEFTQKKNSIAPFWGFRHSTCSLSQIRIKRCEKYSLIFFAYLYYNYLLM